MATTVNDLARFKAEGRRFAMLTAYDFSTAGILDAAGIPAILVGDSLGQVVLGYQNTLPVTIDEMIHHTKAVARGAQNALVVADMPFGSFQVSVTDGVSNAIRLVKEGGAHAVKFEGPNYALAAELTGRDIPVMAHLGLTPQSVHAMGGYRVQGRTEQAAAELAQCAHGMQKAGAFAVVLEGIPSAVAANITKSLDIVTIGIGAGPACDGQILVINDLVGLSPGPDPKFVRRYAELRDTITAAAKSFQQDVQSGRFPDKEHSY